MDLIDYCLRKGSYFVDYLVEKVDLLGNYWDFGLGNYYFDY
jgi:hypothetical protein